MKQFILAALCISAVFAAPTETDVQSAQFMNPMMMNPMMMNPMMMNPMMMNPMMMNPMMMMRNPMMMGCNSCSCMPRCPVIWMCPPVCNPCCCNNTCEENPVDPVDPIEDDKLDMHGPESIMPLPIFPNYPLLDEIAQRILERPERRQYPDDIIVHLPRH